MNSKITICILFCVLFTILGCKSNEDNRILHLETQIADPSYMEGCINITSQDLKRQVGYRNIFPGKTTVGEIETLVGKPEKIFDSPDDSITEWYYSEFNVFINDGIVDWIGTEGLLTIKEIVMQYGCPEMIIHRLREGEGPERIYFIYFSSGVRLSNENSILPLNTDEKLFFVEYIRPVPSVAQYFDRPDVSNDPSTTFIIPWSDAVK